MNKRLHRFYLKNKQTPKENNFKKSNEFLDSVLNTFTFQNIKLLNWDHYGENYLWKNFVNVRGLEEHERSSFK